MRYAPIHVHSEHSGLDGVARVAENVARAVELGCPCCGLTDHKVVSGHLELAQECEKAGIKPLFGVEAYLGVKNSFERNERDQSHAVLFAITDEGLRNVWRIVDSAARDDRFRYVDRISWDALERHSPGVCATSSCLQGLVPKGLLQDDYGPLNRYLDIFGDRFFIELHTYPDPKQEEMNLRLVQVAQERGLPVIYANDSHFARPEQYKIFDMYIARQTGQSIYTPIDERKMWHPPGMHIQSEEEIREHLNYLPDSVVDEALSNTGMIAEMADAHLPGVRRHMPAFIPSESPWKHKYDPKQSPKDVFIDLVWDGILERYGLDASDAVIERTQMELKALGDEDQGLWHYFLWGWDLMQFCKQEGIYTGPGRGSSAGCIVAYALGITDVDPLPYDLYFERFWNPGRAKGFPDIDTDFPRAARRKVIQYLEKRIGEDKVRQIGTIGRMKPKDALEKTGPACGATPPEVEALKKIVSKNVPDIDIQGPESIGWSEETWPGKTIYVMHPTPGECRHEKGSECAHCHTTGDKIVEWVTEQPKDRQKVILKWLNVTDFLCGRIGGAGVHASGTVISDVPLSGEMPCRWSKDQNVPVTQFPMDDVDRRMFLKWDVLGLRTLDTLDTWKDLVGEKGIEFEWSGIEWWNHPVEMWELLDDGFAAGIFQIERGLAKRLCEEFKPRSVSDLSLINALNRPGPIRSGAPDSFIRRRRGDEPVFYDDTRDPKDPKNGWLLQPILEETYGWFLYQENVIKFFEAIGYNKSDADAIRKILGKKKPEDMRDVGTGSGEWEGKGYRLLAKEAGLQEESIERIWRRLEGFAAYSFNKSHTVAYATISFRTLFAKYNGPAEYYLACIRTVDPNKKSILIPRLVNEARRMGIEIKPPHVLKSKADIATIDDAIYYGFRNVKNVAGSGAFLEKLRDRYGYDISSPDALREALDRYDIDQDIEGKRLKAREAGKKEPKTGKQEFGANKITMLEKIGAFDTDETEFALRERQQAEVELLGVILTDNAEEVFAENQDTISECDSINDVLESEWEGDDLRFTVPGIITHIHETRAKKSGKKMGVVTIEYEGDEIEFVVRPDLWRSHRFLWLDRTPGIFTLKRYDGGISFEKGIKL